MMDGTGIGKKKKKKKKQTKMKKFLNNVSAKLMKKKGVVQQE